MKAEPGSPLDYVGRAIHREARGQARPDVLRALYRVSEAASPHRAEPSLRLCWRADGALRLSSAWTVESVNP